jgi:hypothetical protein
MKGRWQLLLILAAVLMCAGLAQTSHGHVLMADVGIYETPPTYTELAFSQPTALPTTLEEPSGDVKLSFGVHNVSDAAQSYQWSIAVVHSGKSQVKASGTVPLPAQGRTSITRSVVVACAGGRTQVVVRLADPAESINFWVTCTPASAMKQAKR